MRLAMGVHCSELPELIWTNETCIQPKRAPGRNMPFGFHSHTSSSSQHAQQIPGAASGILQAGHSLGSIGAPAGNLNNVVPARTAGPDSIYLWYNVVELEHKPGRTAVRATICLCSTAHQSISCCILFQRRYEPVTAIREPKTQSTPRRAPPK
jgi:hypothetical protein